MYFIVCILDENKSEFGYVIISALILVPVQKSVPQVLTRSKHRCRDLDFFGSGSCSPLHTLTFIYLEFSFLS